MLKKPLLPPLTLLLLVLGCGRSDLSDVAGNVTLDGEPLAGAVITFKAPGRPLATAKSDAEGRYRVQTGSAEGMKSGTYQVAVAAWAATTTPAGDDVPNRRLLVPPRYLDPATSGLSAEVPPEGRDDLDFALTSP